MARHRHRNRPATAAPTEARPLLPPIDPSEPPTVAVRATAVAIAVAALAIFLWTLYPSVPGGDSGEMIVATHTLGVPHPSGYPLFVLLSKPFTWLPVGSLAWRVNAFSAVCDAAAVWLLALLVGEWTRTPWAGLLAGGLFAFSPTVWLHATGAEVFPLNNLFVALLLYLAARAWRSRHVRLVYAVAFVAGLSLSNHHTSVFISGVVIAALVWHTRTAWISPRRWLTLAACGAAGLLPYAYLPLASATPSPASWGDQTTLDGFLVHLLRTDYGTFKLGGDLFTRRIDMRQQLAYYGRDALRQLLWIGAPLGVVGLVLGLRDRHTRAALGVSALALVTYLGVFHGLANLPMDRPLIHGVVSRFWQVPTLIVCAWAGLGLAALTNARTRIAAAASIVLVALQIGVNGRGLDQRQNWVVHDFAESMLRAVPAKALLITRGDLILNSARYLQAGEQFRPDVRMLDQEMLTYRWMKRQVAQLMPDVVLPGTHFHVSDPGAYSLRQLVDANIGAHPVFICGGVKDGETSLEGVYQLWPHGTCDRVLPTNAPVDFAEWTRTSGAGLPVFRPGSNPDPASDSWERVAWDDYWESRHRRAFTMLTQGIATPGNLALFEEAAAIIERLLADNPETPPYYYKNLGIAYSRLVEKRPDAARRGIDLWRRYLAVAPSTDAQVPAIRAGIDELERTARAPTGKR